MSATLFIPCEVLRTTRLSVSRRFFACLVFYYTISENMRILHGRSMASSALAWHNMSDEDLLKATSRKNKDAFRELMHRYQERIYRLAYRFTGDAGAAAELTQEIFFKVYCAAPRYTPRARVFTWLYRIAANHCLNFLRDKKNRLLDDAPLEAVAKLHSEETPQVSLEREEVTQVVQQALQRLPERQRIAITLLRFEGMSYREIAGVLGCSTGAVESLIARGMAFLRERLAAYKE